MAEQDIRLPKTRKLEKPSPLRAGMRTDITGKPIKNVILLSLPDREFNLLRPYLEYVDLPHHRILHEAGDRIEFAHFLNQGLASLVVITSDGRSVEVALVGKEGMVGTPLAVGLDRGPYRAIMQISGDGLRVKSDVLTETLVSASELRVILSRYVLMQGLQVAQIAACNRLHEIEQRLFRSAAGNSRIFGTNVRYGTSQCQPGSRGLAARRDYRKCSWLREDSESERSGRCSLRVLSRAATLS